MGLVKPFAFVLMPFDVSFDDVYKLGIQATATERGVVAERVDEQVFSETMLERIYRQIDAADFIIADMTGRNPNVFYEVGYAHACGKLCTLLTSDAGDIPFDLKHHRHLVYGGSIQTLKRLLAPEIDWLIAEMERRTAVPLTVQLKETSGFLNKKEWRATAEVSMTLDMHNRTEKRSPEIEAIYLHTGGGWEYSQGAEECPSTQSDLDDYVLRHFLKPPVTRLSPGAWAPLKLLGRKRVWSKFDGTEAKDNYRMVGHATLEIATSEGTFREVLNLDVMADEIPF
ncbi:MAG: hypothetical protein J0I99_05250 [Devosia sp.]|uniref:hypothetical protein n=1 Tax=Devosia sp. TaxID=1871048 RepID=UPI001AC1D3F9|nr:hypothetical protein [Devosia sp.]MBN9315123.1 hypothetical protein [Devosia sp.]